MQDRLFKVAPDAVHARITYQPWNDHWRLHVGVVVRGSDGEALVEPRSTYEDLTLPEASVVLDEVLAGLLPGWMD